MAKVFNKREYTNSALKKEICDKYGLFGEIADIIIAGGVNSVEDAENFLHPSVEKLLDPTQMLNMVALADRVNAAVKNNETIVVYGDYDADGITATSILCLYLSSKGANVVPFIPERKNGYGLQIQNLEYIAENYYPDLIITVDCGITAVDEVEYIKNDLGIDIIVTDHHEPKENLPDCIVVNPKQQDCTYSFKSLCGAGIALKVVQIMGGIEECVKYMPIAALGTLADCVPLSDENRIIVYYGMKNLRKTKIKGLNMLLDSCKLTANISANDAVMRIVPKINAAGRMGSANRALGLFLCDDEEQLQNLIVELASENALRQQVTEEIINDIYAKIDVRSVYENRVLICKGETWQDGIVGIACARLKESFCRPVILFTTESEEYLKGSARSIEGVDLTELLKHAESAVVNYGGHKQAMGITIRKQDFDEFERLCQEYLKGLDENIFAEKLEYDFDFEPYMCTREFYNQLLMLEPLAFDKRVWFCITTNNCAARALKPASPHIIVSCQDIEMLGFSSYTDYLKVINDNSLEKSFIFSLSYDQYSNRITGIIKWFKVNIDSDTHLENKLLNILSRVTQKAEFLPSEAKSLSCEREVYGKYFKLLRRKGATSNIEEYFSSVCESGSMSYPQFLACLVVFVELGLVEFSLFPLNITISDIKSDLDSSEFFKYIKEVSDIA